MKLCSWYESMKKGRDFIEKGSTRKPTRFTLVFYSITDTAKAAGCSDCHGKTL